jgi:hypothetical protein
MLALDQHPQQGQEVLRIPPHVQAIQEEHSSVGSPEAGASLNKGQLQSLSHRYMKYIK